MPDHNLSVRFFSLSLFKIGVALFGLLVFNLASMPDAEAQRGGRFGRGWGRGGQVYRPVKPTPQLLPMRPRPGRSGLNIKQTPTVKPNTPVSGMKLWKRQVTATGKPVVQSKGRNYQIPQQGVSRSLKSKLLSGTSKTALNTRWNTQKKQVVKNRLSALAAGKTGARSASKSGGRGKSGERRKTKEEFNIIGRQLGKNFGYSRGIPQQWQYKPTKGIGGSEYINPKNNNDRARFMPGDPKSKYPHQRVPYVVRTKKNGKFVDKNGNEVGRDTPEYHIPLREFTFRHY